MLFLYCTYYDFKDLNMRKQIMIKCLMSFDFSLFNGYYNDLFQATVMNYIQEIFSHIDFER